MTLNGGWLSYSGDAKIELAVGLLAVAGGTACAGIRLRRPIRAVRPPTSVVVLMFSLWVVALLAALVGLSVYIKQFLHDYPHIRSGVHNPITPVTMLAALAIFGMILSRTGWRFPTRLGSAVVGAMAAPMIFELPFDLIVMARTYPALPPDPALYRAVFFTPLIMVELTTLWLLTLSPMVRVRRSTLICLALMFGVFGIWALSGFGYPQSALPITMNVVSKIVAFITALTLFLPDRLRDWQTDGPALAPGREQAPQPVTAAPAPSRQQLAQPVMAAPAPCRERVPQPVMAAPVPTLRAATVPNGKVTKGGAVTRVADPAREAIPGGPAIKVLGLRKSFGEKAAVAGIDLEIAAGSFAGLVGPNGAGKTTSLSMMTGLLRPDGGQILINGRDVWADPVAAKAIIGVVPAEARLFDRLSGEELLDYATGMRRKAALGCALIHNPPVLFLDEPLEGVDPVSADAIRRLLTRFAGSGSTVLFSSHVMELVEQVCDHVAIIDQGQIVATGTLDQVRGGKTLQQAFIDLVGAKASAEGLSWLGSSSG